MGVFLLLTILFLAHSPAEATIGPLPHIGSRVGLKAGLFSITSDLTMFHFAGSPEWAWRASLFNASGNDVNRVPRLHFGIAGDLLYRSAQTVDQRSGWYAGISGNIILNSTGQRMGAVGADILVGSETFIGSDRIYVEVGYGILRTGYSPVHSGYNIMIGMSSKP